MNDGELDCERTFDPLPTPAGPWNQPVWLVERPVRFATAGDLDCAVSGCTRPAGTAPGDLPKAEDVLCVAHRRRRIKSTPAPSVPDFISLQATASPIRLARGAMTRKKFHKPIDFTFVHSRLAEELRYVTSIQINRNRWREPAWVVTLLRAALQIGHDRQLVHVADFSDALDDVDLSWTDRASTRFVGLGGLRNLRLALPGMRKILANATADPWEALSWHAVDLNVNSPMSASRPVIHWSTVTCGWLFDGLRRLAREDIQSGAKAWGTVHTYTRAGSVLSAFMDEQAGPLQPEEITRSVLLELVSWLRDNETTRQDLEAVNILARQLERLRDDGVVPDLPDTVFLRRGDNPLKKTRNPKPFPSDLLAGIDQLINDPSVWPDDMQLMMRVFRATGPRASELLEIPPGCVVHAEGRGYSLEYYMSKVDDWRRIPIPRALGEDLAKHQAALLARHPDSPYLFPNFGKAPRLRSLTYSRTHYWPWSYSSFSATVWAIYRKAGVVSSSITGERLTGAQLHRFRHTIATGLLNEGWSQHQVQKFLGHSSPTMMQSYADIHEDTLRDQYTDWVNNSIGIDGKPSPPLSDAEIDVERLRDTMVRATLPNGYCTLPEKQKCSYLPSPCLSCFFFKTTPTFLPIHIRQRDDSLRELDVAKSDGRDRAVEAHTQTVERLDTIIDGLQKLMEDAPNEGVA
ncbi:tyrosine-type recombinase/integrase [Microbacterium paludicola]|uniref:tyrosine-type recombinase/integrase n=1 Tax=Microbacterium paludicola TaxID=300019 RepID=UPI0011A79AF6|nr:tyrosine-type recombinase/integrase [Microbacterium paludicola]